MHYIGTVERNRMELTVPCCGFTLIEKVLILSTAIVEEPDNRKYP